MKRNLRAPVWMVCVVVAMSSPAFAQSLKHTRKPLLKPTRTVKPYNIRYFPALKWRVTLGMARDLTPAIADLDLDGAPEIIVPALDDDSPKLYCLTQNGDVKWRADLPAPPTAGVTLGDIDRDGSLEILVACGSTLLCFDSSGKEEWRFVVRMPAETRTPATTNSGAVTDEGASTLPAEVAQKPSPEEAEESGANSGAGEEAEIHGAPAIADLDGDGQSEIVFGANDNRLHVLTSKGRSKWTFPTKSWIVGGVAIGNLDGDGKLEIVFGSMDFNVYCLDCNGNQKWKYAAYDWVEASPVLADVDKDGELETLVAADDGWLYCLSRRGTLKWKERLCQKQHMKPYLAVADLDGDGTMETIAALPDGSVQAFTAFGDRAWTSNAGGGVLASPLVADLDGDGWPDILLANTSGQFLALDTWGREQWRHNLGQTIEATPVLADLDGNGKWEIYIANLMSGARDSGFFSQFELSVKGGKSAWPALKGDPYRTTNALNARDYGGNLKRGEDYATAWEPFFAGARPRAKLLAPRRLKVTALPLEDIVGNRDGALDPGETALFKVRVQNVGKGASFDTSLHLDLGNSPLKLDRSKTFLGWLAPGASKTVTFRLIAPPLKELLQMLQEQQENTFRDIAAPLPNFSNESTPSATARAALPILKAPLPKKKISTGWQNIQLRVLESGSLAAISKAKVFNVPALPPILKIARRALIDSVSKLSFGNGNARLDSGETAILRVLLKNQGLSTARVASAVLTSPSPDVLVATPQATMRNFVPYGGRQVDFSLRVARKISHQTITLKLKTEVDTGRGGMVAREEPITFSLAQMPLDTIPPSFQLLSPRTKIASTSRAAMTISGVVSDASDISTFSFLKQNVALQKLKKLGPNRYQFIFQRALRVGENVFALSATDGAGNTSTLWVRVVRKP